MLWFSAAVAFLPWVISAIGKRPLAVAGRTTSASRRYGVLSGTARNVRSIARPSSRSTFAGPAFGTLAVAGLAEGVAVVLSEALLFGAAAGASGSRGVSDLGEAAEGFCAPSAGRNGLATGCLSAP